MLEQQHSPLYDHPRPGVFNKNFGQIHLFYIQLLFHYIFHISLIIFIIAVYPASASGADPVDTAINHKTEKTMPGVYYYATRQIAEPEASDIITVATFSQID